MTADAGRVDLRSTGETSASLASATVTAAVNLIRFGRVSRGEGEADAGAFPSGDFAGRLLTETGASRTAAGGSVLGLALNAGDDDIKMSLSVRSLRQERVGSFDGGRRPGGVYAVTRPLGAVRPSTNGGGGESEYGVWRQASSAAVDESDVVSSRKADVGRSVAIGPPPTPLPSWVGRAVRLQRRGPVPSTWAYDCARPSSLVVVLVPTTAEAASSTSICDGSASEFGDGEDELDLKPQVSESQVHKRKGVSV